MKHTVADRYAQKDSKFSLKKKKTLTVFWLSERVVKAVFEIWRRFFSMNC